MVQCESRYSVMSNHYDITYCYSKLLVPKDTINISKTNTF